MLGMSTNPKAFGRTKDEMAAKVRKLLNQAEDPAATPEEAQAFTLKAQQLMSSYSIDLAMVSDARQLHELVARSWTIPNPYAPAKISLVNAVARANDCKALYTDLGGGRRHIEVLGFAADVEWVEILSRSLDIQLMAALAAAVRNKPAGVHGRTFSAGFVQGFIAEIASRLQEARRAAVRAAETARAAGHADDPRSDGPSVALVLVAKAETVESEFRVRHPSARTVHRQIRLRSWTGYNPGRSAGSRANLARGSIGDRRRGLSA